MLELVQLCRSVLSLDQCFIKKDAPGLCDRVSLSKLTKSVSASEKSFVTSFLLG